MLENSILTSCRINFLTLHPYLNILFHSLCTYPEERRRFEFVCFRLQHIGGLLLPLLQTN
jgi:hypothetical protein